MRFSRVAMVYFLVGAAMVGGGVISFDEVGLVSVWVDNPDDPTVNESAVAGESGMLSNLGGPIKNALGTIAGGALLAALGALDTLTGYYAWPMTIAKHLNSPWQVVVMSAAFVAAFTFGLLRVVKSSI